MPQNKTFGVRGTVKYGRMPVAASQTFKKGDFLTVNASNALVLGVAAGSRMGAASGFQNMVVGRAEEDALDENSTLKTAVSYIVAEPGTQFEMPLDHATAASAVCVPSTGQLRTAFEVINVNTNGGYYAVSLDNTTNTKLKIVDYLPSQLPTWPDATTSGTTQYASVWVEFLASQSFHTAVA